MLKTAAWAADRRALEAAMLTVHHLRRSQSERIVWLCEELGLDYVLKCYARDPATMAAPPEYRALHPVGTAPVITDGDLVLAESGAIVDYIIAKYGNGRLALPSDHPDFAQYLFWFHYANGTLQLQMMRNFLLRRAGVADDNPARRLVADRLERNLKLVETRLSVADYFSGREFTAADIMAVFSLTTMRSFFPLDLTPYPHTLAYLKRIGGREAYQRAMKKGDPELTPVLT
jgi:glutathione S-transferase